MPEYNYKNNNEQKEEKKKLFDMNSVFTGRITEEYVEYEGRTFVVKKMNPLEGISVLKVLLTNALPIDLLGGFLDSDNKFKQMLALMPESTKKHEMSVEDFVLFEKRLLKNAYEILASGEVQVIDDAGNFGVFDIEDNLFLVMFLLVKVIEVNYKDFFLEFLRRLGMLEEMKSMAENLNGII